MYLSDRDLEFAVRTGQLIVDPSPDEYDTTSIDLHLDRVEEAKLWDVEAFRAKQAEGGHDPWLRVGKYKFQTFSREFYREIPGDPAPGNLVYRGGDGVILRPGGFFLWQTRESVGTPEVDPRLICFIDGKSSSARAGLLVHLTAPTIHAGWWGQITLEIANLGPFDLCLAEGDAISQIVVATISSPPIRRKVQRGIAIGQKNVGGASATAGSPVHSPSADTR
jgi:dCTP deaminase